MNENINTITYWDNRFRINDNNKCDWELCGGCRQSISFMESIIENCPKYVKEEMKNDTILDFGCAMGDGSDYLRSFLNNKNITGYDFSKNAIKLAKKYNDISFYDDLETLKSVRSKWDYVILSNVLQCVDDYNTFLVELLDITKKGLIIMIPEGDKGISQEHYNIFSKINFPIYMNDSKKNKFIRKKLSLLNSSGWFYKQFIIRYERVNNNGC